MDTVITLTFEIHLSVLIGAAMIGGILVGIIVSALISKRRELRDLINEKL